MCLDLSVIDVLGMFPTGCAVRGSRILNGEKRKTVRIILRKASIWFDS